MCSKLFCSIYTNAGTDTCDITYSYVWRNSVICVTWLIRMCDVHMYMDYVHPHHPCTYGCTFVVWYDSFVCECTFTHIWVMPHIHTQTMYIHPCTCGCTPSMYMWMYICCMVYMYTQTIYMWMVYIHGIHAHMDVHHPFTCTCTSTHKPCTRG